ncbi:helix-turn-helix transcriptional regulator [Enterococcus saccharolyticus]|uniref:HTH cro/C1-type domain-containing protein n=1 Tax=Candidatus Enterococcus willemsii TaxID=1857215 RepID=A0ABQ6YVP2_9ENTE|nr:MULTISPECIES: helix-turn-helix transcriptional regulator [Enterococcus]KAF1301214.1 hypothetical protein BAU17_02785 [Enterococcus sp. CU12B]MCD5003626.1 helix-turn-helix transcriptional regulator [Enterococcus saccharolyticus]
MFKERLKNLRLAQGMTQVEVASALGISQPNFRRWEAGERAPSSETLERLADFFHVSTDYLLGRTDSKESVATYVPTDRGQKYVWNVGMSDNATEMLTYAVRNLKERVQDDLYIICELHNKMSWTDLDKNRDEYFTEAQFRDELNWVRRYLEAEDISISNSLFCGWVKQYSMKKRFDNEQEVLDFLEKE